jgi:MULE transposase domain/MuDR family transposase
MHTHTPFALFAIALRHCTCYRIMASTSTSISIEKGQSFSSLTAAKAAIKQAISSRHESYIVHYSDKKRFRIICPQRGGSNCNFQVRATNSKRHGAIITHYKPHTCSPATHFTAKNTHSLQFLLPHHRAAIIDNPSISVKQIQSNEHLQFYNKISYRQAHRVKEAALQEIWGDESECFAQFPDYIQRFNLADSGNRAYLDTSSDNRFTAAFFAPAGLRRGARYLRGFTAIDGTHTKSRYRMLLLIACGIDANSNVFPLAWALVPIEDESWWNWFLVYLKASYPCKSITLLPIL